MYIIYIYKNLKKLDDLFPYHYFEHDSLIKINKTSVMISSMCPFTLEFMQKLINYKTEKLYMLFKSTARITEAIKK